MQLHQRKTRFNDITVTEDCGIRTLWSPGNVRQTAVLATDPTVPVLEYARNTLLALAFCEQLHTALVLGLGGGAIPRLLQRGNPGLTVDIVEIDPQMVEVAREYFAFRPANDLRVIVDDACRFIEAAPPASYDMVVLDAYLGMQMPAAMADQAAVHNLAAAPARRYCRGQLDAGQSRDISQNAAAAAPRIRGYPPSSRPGQRQYSGFCRNHPC